MSGWGVGDIPDQQGRTVIITGANSGLGAVAARSLDGAGEQV
ncbi:MAG: short-chain dehydrogenase, partial [Nocardia sp.]|nr:short-chain dehydrogenase [Nocardia sp.]